MSRFISSNLACIGRPAWFPHPPQFPVDLADPRIIEPFPYQKESGPGKIMQLSLDLDNHGIIADRNWRPYVWAIRGAGSITRSVHGWVSSPGFVSDVDDIDYSEAVDAGGFSVDMTSFRVPPKVQPDFTIAPADRPLWIRENDEEPSGGAECPFRLYGSVGGHFIVIDNGTQRMGAYSVLEATFKAFTFTNHAFARNGNAFSACAFEVAVNFAGFASNPEPPFNMYDSSEWFVLEGSGQSQIGEWICRSETENPNFLLKAGDVQVQDDSKAGPLETWGSVPMYRHTTIDGIFCNVQLICKQRYLPHPEI